MIPMHVEVWIECERCSVAYGGAGLTRAVQRVGNEVVCTECLRKLTPALVNQGVASPREAASRRTTGELALGDA